MRIVVCVKPSKNGEIGPFEASAYESALRIKNAEVILLSMAPESSKEMLEGLSRLGAKEVVLLTDKAFSGADTLATGYTLSLAIKKLAPDLIFTGRQTLEGDTAQVGIGLATRLSVPFISEVMEIKTVSEKEIVCVDRENTEKKAVFPALLTFERICNLRMPSIRSTISKLTTLNKDTLGADENRIGQKGSPTHVVATFESTSERRKCKFVSVNDFTETLKSAINEPRVKNANVVKSDKKLKKVWTVGNKAFDMASTVSEDITVIPYVSADELVERIKREKPNAVLFDSTKKGKELASIVAVKTESGLCADCIALETDGNELYMIRPAFGGDVTAKIVCKTTPQMATVRTEEKGSNVIFSIGAGAIEYKDELTELAKRFGAETGASRMAVDKDAFPYEKQIGLTGRSVSPEVYVAFGISGAVHHIAGIRGAKKIIAVNSDRSAPIFDYADYGIVADVETLLSCLMKK